MGIVMVGNARICIEKTYTASNFNAFIAKTLKYFSVNSDYFTYAYSLK